MRLLGEAVRGEDAVTDAVIDAVILCARHDNNTAIWAESTRNRGRRKGAEIDREIDG
jgi:hypothetical protein